MKYLSKQKSGFKKQAGVSLIEAMVSLLVFSVGALGLAALQTASMTIGGDTKQRSLAIWKAQELADRMRSTKTAGDPLGPLRGYVAAINNDAAGIGEYNEDVFVCPVVPTRCADYRDAGGNLQAGQNCDEAELIAFDIWDVLCEPSTGLSPAPVVGAAETDSGVIGLQNMEVAMVEDPATNEFFLYVEWLSRSAENNQLSTQGNANDLLTEDVSTELCGVPTDLDPRVDAYCLRIK